MARATNGDVSLYYEVDGSGPTVAFVGELGLGAWQWGWQHAAVAGPYETLVYDARGVGRSDAPPGPYSVGALARDLAAVLSDHGVGDAHLVGCGLGGMVALRYALESSRPESVAVVGTPARGGGFHPDPLWADPADPAALVRSTEALLSAGFVERQPDVLEQVAEWRGAEDADRRAWEAARAAVDGFDLADRLYELTTPTLVLHGAEDAVCPVARGAELAEGLPRGELVEYDGAGHLVTVERSRAVNDRLLAWLDDHADRDL